MSLADVQVILDALDTNRAAAFQKQQLAQQHDEFTKRLEQEHENMLAQHDIEKSNSRMNLALHASTNPNFLQSLPNVTLKGTTGDPGYQSPMIGGQPLALNPSRDPNQLNTYSTEFGDVSSPTMPTYIAQQFALKSAEANATEQAQEKLKGVEAGYASTAAEKLADSQLKQEIYRQTQETNRANQERINDLLKAQLTAAVDREKMKSEENIHGADNRSREYITKLNLGMGDPGQEGSFAKELNDKAMGVYLGDQSSKSAKADLGLKGQIVNMDNHLLAIGGTSLNDNQISALNTLPMIRNLIGQIDAFNKIDGVNNPIEKYQAQQNITALLPNLATTVDGTGKSRMTTLLINAANAAYKVSRLPDSLNANEQIRDNIVRTFRDFANEQTGNLSPKQRADVLYHKGFSDLKTLGESKRLGKRPISATSATGTGKYDPVAEGTDYANSITNKVVVK